jgi:hypothetical protein
MALMHFLALILLAGAQRPQTSVGEPKEIKSAKALKPDEGIVRLSVRSQRQFIETAYLYFVEVKPDGSDGTQVLRFERGAGVPVMGTNMVDVKAKYYRVPEGRYRLLAYTLACAQLPTPGTTCFFGGKPVPTGAYMAGSPMFEVSHGAVTDAGDFVIEYVKATDLDTVDLFADSYSAEGYDVRWRSIGDAIRPEFAALPAGPAISVPAQFRSRIECEQRPKDKTIQFPFRCPAAGSAP